MYTLFQAARAGVSERICKQLRSVVREVCVRTPYNHIPYNTSVIINLFTILRTYICGIRFV